MEEAVILISLKIAKVNVASLQESRRMVSPKSRSVSHRSKGLQNKASMDKSLAGVAIGGKPLPAGGIHETPRGRNSWICQGPCRIYQAHKINTWD